MKKSSKSKNLSEPNSPRTRSKENLPANCISENLLPPTFRVQRIVSGGQTGVDRAGLDVAIALGIEHGGWCPRGRLAEDGSIPDQYQLVEMESRNYRVRTRQNVIDSDGTLVLFGDSLQGGSLLTTRFAADCGKPCLKVRLQGRVSTEQVISWIEFNQISVMNVAGPRASSDPDIYAKAHRFLMRALR